MGESIDFLLQFHGLDWIYLGLKHDQWTRLSYGSAKTR